MSDDKINKPLARSGEIILRHGKEAYLSGKSRPLTPCPAWVLMYGDDMARVGQKIGTQAQLVSGKPPEFAMIRTSVLGAPLTFKRMRMRQGAIFIRTSSSNSVVELFVANRPPGQERRMPSKDERLGHNAHEMMDAYMDSILLNEKISPVLGVVSDQLVPFWWKELTSIECLVLESEMPKKEQNV